MAVLLINAFGEAMRNSVECQEIILPARRIWFTAQTTNATSSKAASQAYVRRIAPRNVSSMQCFKWLAQWSYTISIFNMQKHVCYH